MTEDKLQTREQMLASMAQQSNGWVTHDGGPCPVDGDIIVEPQYRGDEDREKGIRISMTNACHLAWWHDGEDDDIIAYRVVKP